MLSPALGSGKTTNLRGISGEAYRVQPLEAEKVWGCDGFDAANSATVDPASALNRVRGR